MATTVEAINALLAGQQEAYNKQLENEKRIYDQSVERLNAARDSAMQEAYLASREAQRQLPQALAARGMHGGLTESSLVDLANNYQRSRNSLSRTYADNLADLELDYAGKVSNIEGLIAQAKAEAEAARIDAMAAQMAYGGGYSSSGTSSTDPNANNPYRNYSYSRKLYEDSIAQQPTSADMERAKNATIYAYPDFDLKTANSGGALKAYRLR